VQAYPRAGASAPSAGAVSADVSRLGGLVAGAAGAGGGGAGWAAAGTVRRVLQIIREEAVKGAGASAAGGATPTAAASSPGGAGAGAGAGPAGGARAAALAAAVAADVASGSAARVAVPAASLCSVPLSAAAAAVPWGSIAEAVLDGVAEVLGEVENLAASLGVHATDHIRPGESVLVGGGLSGTLVGFLKEANKVRIGGGRARRVCACHGEEGGPVVVHQPPMAIAHPPLSSSPFSLSCRSAPLRSLSRRGKGTVCAATLPPPRSSPPRPPRPPPPRPSPSP
jgi:hypothetical protein